MKTQKQYNKESLLYALLFMAVLATLIYFAIKYAVQIDEFMNGIIGNF